MSRRSVATICAALCVSLVPGVSRAAFHFAEISEVMTSYGGDPTKQFVEIRTTSSGQIFTQHSVLAAFDAAGNYIADVLEVPGNLSNGAAGAHWIMATSSFIGATPDFVIPSGIIPTGGGMVCWGGGGGLSPQNPPSWSRTNFANYVDCVAYGTYSGPTNVRVSAPTSLDGDGHSLQRIISGNNNAADFTCGDPATPANNAGAAGSLPATAPCPPTPTPTVTPTATATRTATATATATGTRFPEDHFKVYKAKIKKGTTAFVSPPDPTLHDQFETKITRVIKPKLLGNPVNKNGEGFIDPAIHLECYAIKDAKTSPKQPKFPGRRVQIDNQFGSLTLDVTKIRQLCVPSLKDESTPPTGPLPANNVDNFKCYKAKVPKGFTPFAKRNVTLDDQFQTGKITTVIAPVELCNPVDKDAELIKNPAVHLVCYKIKDAPMQTKFTPTDVFTFNEFDSEQLTATKASLLCLPSTKADLGPIP